MAWLKTGEPTRIRRSIERISRWMNAHGAPLLVENLAPGASTERLARAETELGVVLPSDLRALWQWWKDSGGTNEELHSNHWFPFAAQDSDSLVVHGDTGRVFRCDHDDSPKLLAPSLAEWFERYADRVEADDYAVEDGFGDYYLSLRDRDAERREHERAQRQADHDRMRRETSLLDRFRDSIATADEDRCIEVLSDALERDDKNAFNAAVALLFTDKVDAKFVAGALRPVLNAVSLAPDHWVDVAVGGALLGNNAIRDVAIAHASELSVSRLNRLEKVAAAASSSEREALNGVLQRLRAKRPSDAPADAPTSGDPGNWLSRMFKKRPPKK